MTVLTKDHVRELRAKFGHRISFNTYLSKISYWKIGGPSDAVVYTNTEKEICLIIKWCKSKNIPFIIVGNTSNLLFSDCGLQGVLIKISEHYANIEVEGNKITAQAGASAPALARKAMKAGLSGIEHICGIPGTVGGLIYMNGGSQRKTISTVVTEVTTVDEYGNIQTYSGSECGFSYRQSIFQGKKEYILKVTLELESGKSTCDIRNEMLTIMKSRRLKFPQKLPNCGSVFISDPEMFKQYGPPGRVIENCGLKGFKKNKAQISDVHANFIVNNGGATAKDVLYLINKARAKVYETTGYSMKIEAKYVSRYCEIIKIEDL